MANLRKDLSKLSGLIVFEAAARSDNFSRAAEELGMTRVSVSRQIADLEADLGTRLFYRDHRKTRLTQDGRVLETVVRPALNDIASVMQQVRTSASDKRLTVTTTTAMATYWLMPRMADFNALHPEVELNLVVSDRYLDLEAEQIDVAIRYTEEVPERGEVTPLFRERIYPVYSPKYRPRTGMAVPEDLLQENLLSLSGRYKRGARWPSWFSQVGLATPGRSMGVAINTYINMLQAALEGQGVGLAGFPLADPYLADGRLLTNPEFPSVERDFFYLIDQTGGRDDAGKFCAWVKEQAEETLKVEANRNRTLQG
jgi:DNA-binding transcriptional LysR family regulator